MNVQWPAPAKLNLFLHITGRRSDGYHTLQTLYQFLDYGDTLTFDITSDGTITRIVPLAGVSEADDLTMRAAYELQRAAAVTKGARIAASKRIPIGGGLGGGSSDAATTLLALNTLWGVNWSLADLARLGLNLGADVPVFVHGRSAWAEGIGDILTWAEPAETWYVVLIPPISISTAEIFEAFELTGLSPAITIRRGRKDARLVTPIRWGAYERVGIQRIYARGKPGRRTRDSQGLPGYSGHWVRGSRRESAPIT
jgi:4-diphosphocytidyl-2-C-methyl-D-erythritol kinase